MKRYKPLQIIFLILAFIFAISAQGSKTSEVSVNVTVTDAQGHFIEGLTSDNFRLYENGREKTDKTVVVDKSPITIGFLVDVSGSMTANFESYPKFNRVDWGREAILDFLAESDKNNDYFLSAFGAKPNRFSNFYSKDEIEEKIRDDSNFATSKDTQTSLYDSVALAIEYISRSKNERKMLFILSDGFDNESLRNYKELRKLSKENKVTIFLIAISDPTFKGPLLVDEINLNELTNTSGGQAYYLNTLENTKAAAKIIANEIKTQYKLSFTSTIDIKENKWRALQIKLVLPKEKKKSVKLVTHPKGYFTNSETLPTN